MKRARGTDQQSSKAAAVPRKRPKAPPAKAGATHTRIYVLSDSTGNLPRHMLTAFLTQFPPETFQLRLRSFLTEPLQIDAAMAEVAAEPGMVLHALVGEPAKEQVRARCVELGVPACDLTGDFVQFIARASGVAPEPNVERLHHTDATYHRRIRALEFTLDHDDGLGLDTVHQADVVLAGVSRTSKTPTSIYLAQQGYKTANVSLALEVAPPAQLLALPATKVIGLVIDAVTLSEIRTRRQHAWAMGSTSYNDPGHVEKEVLWSRRLFAQRGWSILNVTDQAIEETAARVVNLLKLPPGMAM